jgi:hypothetical protein
MSSGSREAGDHLTLRELPHLAGIVLDDSLAKGHLSVASDDNFAALPHGHDRRSVPGRIRRIFDQESTPPADKAGLPLEAPAPPLITIGDYLGLHVRPCK